MALRSRAKRVGLAFATMAMVRLRRAARLIGLWAVLVLQWSSPKVTSRRQWLEFSIFQWLRMRAANWAGEACSGVRLVM